MIRLPCCTKIYWEGAGSDFRVVGHESTDEATASLIAEYGKDARVQWNEAPEQAGHTRGTVTFAVGATLGTRERNGYDDSDFYAVWWDGRRLRQTLYNTTRCHLGGSAVVDGPSDADRERIDDRLVRWYARRLLRRAVLDYQFDKSHRQVRVVRGRKVPKESTWKSGKVFEGGYGKCVHLYPLEGGPVAHRYVAATNIEIDEPPLDLARIRQMIRDARRLAEEARGQIGVHLPFCAEAYSTFAL